MMEILRDKYVTYECIKEGPNPEFNRLGSMYINYVYEYYMFDGTSWNVEDKIYRLTSDDYDAMGTESSSYPGKYNNFSSSVDPNKFLPIWMKIKWAYEDEGATKMVSYIYYNNSSDKELKSDEYIYQNNEWIKYPTVIQKTEIFAYKNNSWVFVPPLKFVKTDKAKTKTFRTDNKLTDEDYELVGNGNHKNFDVRTGKAEEDESVIIGKIATILKAVMDEIVAGDVFEITYKSL